MRRTPTSSKSVVPFILTNPVGIDGIVKALQAQLLSDLPWLQKSFNRATVMSKKNKEGDNEEFPICFVADGKDELNMIGQDNWSAYSFFVARDTETPIDFDQFNDSKTERNLSLYVWINLDEANAIEAFEYPDVLKQQIRLAIRNTVFLTDETLVIESIEDDPLVVFDGFTLDPAKTQSLYHPYKAFRFDLSCTYTDTIVCLATLPTPSNLVLSNVLASAIQLDWDLNSEGNETGVLVQRNEDGAGFVDLITLGAGVETHTDLTVSDSTDYDYRVQAKNGALFSDSAFSNIASATTESAGFISTWNTANTGTSNNDQIELPTPSGGTYNYTVTYLGNVIHSSTSFSDNVVTFPDGAGIKEIDINGTITGWRFNGLGDADKITNISNWGPLNLGNSGSYFRGCSNITLAGAVGDLDMTGTTNFTLAFSECLAMTSFPAIDTSLVTNMTDAWSFCRTLLEMPLIDTSSVTGTGFRQTWFECNDMITMSLIDVSGVTSFFQTWGRNNALVNFPLIDTSSITDFFGAWVSCDSLTSFPLIDTSAGLTFESTWGFIGTMTSFPTIDLSSMTSGSNMFTSTNISTASWDALLVATETNNQNNNVSWTGGTQQHTKAPSGAATAIAALIADHSWTIIDGGPTP